MRYKSILLLALIFSFSVCFAGDIEQVKGIPNFHKVEEGFYRGGCPTEAGLKYLKAIAVRTIVDLRRHGTGVEKEKRTVESLGLRYINIPFRFMRMPPKDEEVKKFLEIASNPQNRPIFLHCQHGRDRTGMMVATYRIAAQGWHPKDALIEANELGLRPFYLQMKYFILKKAEKFKDDKEKT